MDSKHDAVCGTYNLLLDEAIKNYKSPARLWLSPGANSMQSNSSLQYIKSSNARKVEELMKIRTIKSSEEKNPEVSSVESDNVLHSEEQQLNLQSGRDKFFVCLQLYRKSCSLLMKSFRRMSPILLAISFSFIFCMVISVATDYQSITTDSSSCKFQSSR